LPATLPFGAINESSPSSGSSEATRTRKGAPFQGEIGEDKTAISDAAPQLPSAFSAWESTAANRRTKNAPPTSDKAVTAAANGRKESKLSAFPL
jgi:hypothetical protein